MNHISTYVRIASQWGKEHESPAICVISRFSTKSIVFQKEFLNVFSIKKGKLHLAAMNCNELSNLYWIVLLISFFLFFCGLEQKAEPNLRNYSYELQNQVEHNSKNKQIAPDYSSATAIMLVIFWIEHDFCIISGCRDSFKNKLKNLWTIRKFL